MFFDWRRVCVRFTPHWAHVVGFARSSFVLFISKVCAAAVMMVMCQMEVNTSRVNPCAGRVDFITMLLIN
jgi:hypothetical protein